MSCLAKGCVTFAVAPALLKAPGDKGVNCTGVARKRWAWRGREGWDRTPPELQNRPVPLSLAFMASLTVVQGKIKISSYRLCGWVQRVKDRRG